MAPSVTLSLWRPVARVCLPAAALFFALLVGVGNLPGLAAELSAAVGDKRLHLMSYAFLATLLYLSLNRARVSLALLIVSLLGIVDEGIQSFFAYRSANALDLLADIAAAGATVTLLHIISTAFATEGAVTKP